MRRNAFLIFSLVSLSAILLQSCGSSNGSTNLASAFSCTVTGTVSGTTVISPTVSVYSGNGGPYTFTYNGQTLGSTSSTSFTIPTTVVTGGSVTVTDSSDGASASCVVNSTTGTTGVGYSNGVTVYANGQVLTAGTTVSEPIGTSVTLTATSVSGSQSFSFTTASISVSGITLSQTGANSATLYDSSSVTGTITVNVTDTTNSAYTAQVSLGFGTSGTYGTYGYNGNSLGCTLSHTQGTYEHGYTSLFYLVATTGEELEVTSGTWSPGYLELNVSSYPFIPPYSTTSYGQQAQVLPLIEYSPGVTMTVQITASSATRGIPCVNTQTGQALLTDSVYLQ